MIAITASDKSLTKQAQLIAKQWSFDFVSCSSELFQLQLTAQRLQLIQTGDMSPGPVHVEFSCGQAAHRRHYGGGKGQTIAKAVCLSSSQVPLILDATAGLGRDAFVFASLGARVILVERSAIAAALLADGMQRASSDKEISAIISRMQLIYADALELMPKLASEHSQTPDVVYLDPMFPHRKKTAAVKKEMSSFQHLVGADCDSDHLLAAAMQLARKRVVVKRPIKAPLLANKSASFSLPMKKHRFDIYLTG